MKIWTPCDCRNKIEGYLAKTWFARRKGKLPPPASSLILCDCGKVYELQVNDEWVEVGEDRWQSVVPSSSVACSASS